MSFLPVTQWYVYFSVSRSWKHVLDQPYSYHFIRRLDYIRDRYQEAERVSAESNRVGWRDGYDESATLCAHGCCYDHDGGHNTQHKEARDDESDENTDDEPFTNDDTGEVDEKEKTRWNVQRGSAIWKHQIGITDENVACVRDELQPAGEYDTERNLSPLYRQGLKQLKATYSSSPDDITLLDHSNIAKELLHYVNTIFQPLFHGGEKCDNEDDASSGSDDGDDDEEDDTPPTESKEIANELSIGAERTAALVSDTRSSQSSHNSHQSTYPLPPLYLIPVLNGYSGDIIDRWHQPILAASSLHPDDPHEDAINQLNDILISPTFDMPFNHDAADVGGAATSGSSVSSSSTSSSMAASLSTPPKAPSNDPIDTTVASVKKDECLWNLLPPTWPLSPSVVPRSDSSSTVSEAQHQHMTNKWLPIGALGTYGHGILSDDPSTSYINEMEHNGIQHLLTAREDLSVIASGLRHIISGGNVATNPCDLGSFHEWDPPWKDANIKPDELPEQWRGIIYRLLDMAHRFPTFGLLIWISHLWAHLSQWDMAITFFDSAFLHDHEKVPRDVEFNCKYNVVEMKQKRDAGKWNDIIHHGIHKVMRRSGIVHAVPQTCDLIGRVINGFIRETLSDAIKCYHERQADIAKYDSDADDDDIKQEKEDDANYINGIGFRYGHGACGVGRSGRAAIPPTDSKTPREDTHANTIAIDGGDDADVDEDDNDDNEDEIDDRIDDVNIPRKGTARFNRRKYGRLFELPAVSLPLPVSEVPLVLTSADIQSSLLIQKPLWFTGPVYGYDRMQQNVRAHHGEDGYIPESYDFSDEDDPRTNDDENSDGYPEYREYTHPASDWTDNETSNDECDETWIPGIDEEGQEDEYGRDQWDREGEHQRLEEMQLKEYDLPNELNSDDDDVDDDHGPDHVTSEDATKYDQYQGIRDIVVDDPFTCVTDGIVRSLTVAQFAIGPVHIEMPLEKAVKSAIDQLNEQPKSEASTSSTSSTIPTDRPSSSSVVTLSSPSSTTATVSSTAVSSLVREGSSSVADVHRNLPWSKFQQIVTDGQVGPSSSSWAHHRKRRYIDETIQAESQNDVRLSQYKRARWHHDNSSDSHPMAQSDYEEGDAEAIDLTQSKWEEEARSAIPQATIRTKHRPGATHLSSSPLTVSINEIRYYQRRTKSLFHLGSIRWLVERHLNELLSSSTSSISSSSSSSSGAPSAGSDNEKKGSSKVSTVSDTGMLVIREALQAALIELCQCASFLSTSANRTHVLPVDLAMSMRLNRHRRAHDLF